MMQSEHPNFAPPTNYSPPSATISITTDQQQQPIQPQQQKKAMVIVDRASKKFTALEDSVIGKYDVLQDHKHPKLFVRISTLLALFSIVTFCIWILTTPYGYPWFIHTVYIGILGIAFLYIWGSNRYQDKPLAMHFVFFILTSFKLIIVNEHTPSNFPWCVYPIGVMIFAICIHAMIVQFRQYLHHIYIHALIYSIVNVLLFITYCYTVHNFPWFFIVWLVWSIFFLAHFIIWKVITFRFEKKKQQQAPTLDSSTDATSVNTTTTTNNSVIVNAPPIQQQQTFATPTNTFNAPPTNNNLIQTSGGVMYSPPPMMRSAPVMQQQQSQFTGDIDEGDLGELSFEENEFYNDDSEFKTNPKQKGPYQQV
ncbi:hypothetical protein ABK040_007502 [Willaertia magna]